MAVRSSFQRGLLFACALLTIVSVARGGPITVQVAGTVTSSDFPSIVSGSPVTGSYTYDDAQLPTSSTPPHYAEYRWFSFTLGFVDGSTVSTDMSVIDILNDAGLDEIDGYSVSFLPSAAGSTTLTGAFDGNELTSGGINLSDQTGTAWDDIYPLPNPATILALGPTDYSDLQFMGPGGVYLHFEITELSVVPVPVPGALLLGAIGLGCSRCLLRRRTT